jgi:uncharacterized protein YqhQ
MSRLWKAVKWSALGLAHAAQAVFNSEADPPESKPMQFSYGGQAVIEGVMMRGQYVAAIAVRKPKFELVVHEVEADAPMLHGPYAAGVMSRKGKTKLVITEGLAVRGPYKGELEKRSLKGPIVTREVPLNAALYRGRIAKLPFVRGLVMLWDALGLGTSALMWSADVALEEEDDVDFSFEGAAGVGLVVFSLALGIGLFFVLPAAASAAVKEVTGLDSKLAADIIEGVIKLAILIGYIAAIGFMEDVKRLFGYHGAEHKTINAYEDGAELTPAIVGQYPIEHPRCGTAFLLTLVSLSVFIHIITGRPDNVILLMLSRVVLLFPVAGIAYEVIRFTAKHLDNPFIRLVIKPNLALQGLTTRQPDTDMLEVGITALERVLAAERAGAPVPETKVSEVPVAQTGD